MDERQEHGGASPHWARTILVLGATTVIALYLVYWITTSIDKRLIKLQESVDREHAFLFAVCVNTAGDNKKAYTRCMAAVDGKMDMEN